MLLTTRHSPLTTRHSPLATHDFTTRYFMASRLTTRHVPTAHTTDAQAKMPNAEANFKAADDPFNKTPDWLGTLAGLIEEFARSREMATVLPRTAERAKGGKELQARGPSQRAHMTLCTQGSLQCPLILTASSEPAP